MIATTATDPAIPSTRLRISPPGEESRKPVPSREGGGSGTGAGAHEGQALTTRVAQMMALVKVLRPEGEPPPKKTELASERPAP